MRPCFSFLAGLVLALLMQPPPAQAQNKTALAKDVEKLLKKHCHQCHGQDGSAEGGFNYILNRNRLVEAGKLVPEHADKSKLYKRVRSGDMPPEDTALRPTQDEIALLKKWIDAGAPNFAETVAVRPMIRPEETPRLLYADLQNVEERDRRFTRYFTLSHLYNARLSEDELQSYRAALAKLVNSLSWGRKIVVPKAIDPAKTIFRIDLRDYQWTPEIWEAILHRNPYGILYETNVEKDLQKCTETQLPYVRGDWFVSDASRPPLYHELLQVPATVHELEKLLRLDAEQNIRSERVVRAGFNSSGISRSNRLIERHESSYGAYWKSYDFAGNAGRQNLFAYPLGSGTTPNSFQHDGGEMIFALPNGLHGYMLTTGHGKRLDKGPVEIVSDLKRTDRTVINGLSCMSCHAQGIISKEDQIRPYVEKNPDAFPDKELTAIKALYPSAKKLTELYEEDRKLFREAVARTGAVLTKTEPVSALATLFEQQLNLELCVAELGLTEEELPRRLTAASAVRRVLGSLLVPGGTVQRDLFATEFANIVHELRLGRPYRMAGGPPRDLPGTGNVTKPEIKPTVRPVTLTEQAPRHYQLHKLEVGARIFSDRNNYLFYKVPEEMVGSTYLLRDTGELHNAGLHPKVVQAAKDVTIYLIVLTRAHGRESLSELHAKVLEKEGWTLVKGKLELNFPPEGGAPEWQAFKRVHQPQELQLPLRIPRLETVIQFAFK